MIDQLLSKLEKVKSAGASKWVACCPVHGDKNPSLTITDDGSRILCHCFACGANGKDVAESVGLPLSVLFADRLDPLEAMKYRREQLERERDADVLFLRLYEKAEREGREILLSDRKRKRLADNRLASLNAILG
jgi:hypothetical protein